MGQTPQQSNNLAQPTNALSNLPPDQLALKTEAAIAVISIINSVMRIATSITEGREYRASLQAMVETLKADQAIRYQDVEKILEILKVFAPQMSQKVRDEYFMTILELLDSPRQNRTLPTPK